MTMTPPPPTTTPEFAHRCVTLIAGSAVRQRGPPAEWGSIIKIIHPKRHRQAPAAAAAGAAAAATAAVVAYLGLGHTRARSQRRPHVVLCVRASLRR